jgi:hypothetical protein
MPFKIRKLPNLNRYKVYNPITGKVYAYRTSLSKAEAQVRLLYMRERKKSMSK